MAHIEAQTPSEGSNLRIFPSPNKIYIQGGYVHEVYKVSHSNVRGLRLRFLPFEGYFGYGDSFIDHDKARHNIQRGGKVIFARTLETNPRDVGALTYRVRKVHVNGEVQRVVEAGVRAINPEFQQKGIGSDLARVALAEEMPDAWIGLIRTWRMQRANEGTGWFRESYPFRLPRKTDEITQPRGVQRFTPEAQQILQAVLSHSSVLAKVDLETGVCKRCLPPLKSDRFIPPAGNERAVEIDRMMRKYLGVTPENGDGVETLHLTDKDAIRAAIEGGFGRGIAAPASSDRFSSITSRLGSLLRFPLRLRLS